MSAHAGEQGKALISFALLAPPLFFILFTAWELGVQTATIPSMKLALRSLNVAGASFTITDSGFLANDDGIVVNLKRLVDLSADIMQQKGNPYGVAAVAYHFDCSAPINAGNPHLVGYEDTNSSNTGILMVEADVETKARTDCITAVNALPNAQCDQSSPTANLMQWICYAGVVSVKTSSFSPAETISNISLYSPGGPCPPPEPPPLPPS